MGINKWLDFRSTEFDKIKMKPFFCVSRVCVLKYRKKTLSDVIKVSGVVLTEVEI